MSFERYMDVVSGNFKQAIKVEWLNPDETVNFEFTNALYDMNANVSVNYQNGSRRTCTLTLNNFRNRFPINFNNIWIGQKFKLWMGVYIDEKTPYYFPQGVFYVSNPDEAYQPSSKTITINGVDKWAFLDGTLHGTLSGTYQTNIGVNLYDAARALLTQPVGSGNVDYTINSDSLTLLFDKIDEGTLSEDDVAYGFSENPDSNNNFRLVSNNKGVRSTEAKTTLVAKYNMVVSFRYSYNTEENCDLFKLKVGSEEKLELSGKGSGEYRCNLAQGDSITFIFEKDEKGAVLYGDNPDSVVIFDIRAQNVADLTAVVDPIPPKFSSQFIGKKTVVSKWNEDSQEYEDEEVEVLLCPYTANVERGGTYADVLLEYATILCAHIYYDVHGRLTLEPMIDTAEDITDTNKEIVWHYTVDEKTFLGLTQNYNFDKIYNDIIVLGNIVNGRQFKARVQNRNLMSDTCVQKIGLKTKEPFEDNQYYADEQCRELAMYYAKTDTILQKSGTISSTVLYHLDVNKLVTVSTPNNYMSKELFLISGYSLSSSGTMSITVTSVNILKDFSVVEVGANG